MAHSHADMVLIRATVMKYNVHGRLQLLYCTEAIACKSLLLHIFAIQCFNATTFVLMDVFSFDSAQETALETM